MTSLPSPALAEVPLDALDEVEDYDGEAYPPVFVRHGGVPFTGVVLDRKDSGVTRLEYRDGQLHGTCRTLDAEGRLRWEARYVAGKRAGESRAWGPDGTLRHLERYDEQGASQLSQHFDAAGRLRYERTPTRDRTWYAEGGLRSDRQDGRRWVYARDGRRVFCEGVQTLEQARVHDHFELDDDALASSLMEILGDFEFARGVWMWLHRRLDAGDESALDDLRRALGHEQLDVRTTAMHIIGSRGLVALEGDVRAMLDDDRVPPTRFGEYPGQGGRGHTFTLGRTAAATLAQLAAGRREPHDPPHATGPDP